MELISGQPASAPGRRSGWCGGALQWRTGPWGRQRRRSVARRGRPSLDA